MEEELLKLLKTHNKSLNVTGDEQCDAIYLKFFEIVRDLNDITRTYVRAECGVTDKFNEFHSNLEDTLADYLDAPAKEIKTGIYLHEMADALRRGLAAQEKMQC